LGFHQTPLGELTALLQTPCCRGPILLRGEKGEEEERREDGERRRGTEFVICPRKKKEKSAPKCRMFKDTRTAATRRVLSRPQAG